MPSPGHVAYAKHQFCQRTNEAEAEQGVLGARLQQRRRNRNAACAMAKHQPGDCEDCQQARTDTLKARFREAEREANALLKGNGDNPWRMPEVEAIAEVPPPPVPAVLIAVAVAVWLSRQTG